ncbi:protein kinase [Streptomyces parvulus]|nr:protein kinase [Streptomyces parvulus]
MSLTATGAIMGTFGYMAPEVLAGQRATQASDVFAWAAVVLYAATATEPFRGENIAEVAHRTATVDPDLGVLPPEIRPLMAAALAKDPQHRPTASDLLLGLVGAPVKAADPRAALMEAGARKAAAPAADTAPADGGTSPGTGAGHTVVEAPLGERAEAAFQALAPPPSSPPTRCCSGSPCRGPRPTAPRTPYAPPDRPSCSRTGPRANGSASPRRFRASPRPECCSRTPTARYGRPAPPCCPPGGGCTPGPTPTGRGSTVCSASVRRPGCGRRTVNGRRTCCAAPSCAAASTGCPRPRTTCGPTRWNCASSRPGAPPPPAPHGAVASCWRGSPARRCSPWWRAGWRGRRTGRPSSAVPRPRPGPWRGRRKRFPVRNRRRRCCWGSPPGGSPKSPRHGRR